MLSQKITLRVRANLTGVHQRYVLIIRQLGLWVDRFSHIQTYFCGNSHYTTIITLFSPVSLVLVLNMNLKNWSAIIIIFIHLSNLFSLNIFCSCTFIVSLVGNFCCCFDKTKSVVFKYVIHNCAINYKFYIVCD